MSAPQTPLQEYREGLRLELERLLHGACPYGPLPYNNAVDLLAEAKRALASEARLLEALKAIEPFLPALDDGPVRHSAHAQAAGMVRAAIAKAEGESCP